MTEKEIEKFRYETASKILAAFISAGEHYTNIEDISVENADKLINILNNNKSK